MHTPLTEEQRGRWNHSHELLPTILDVTYDCVPHLYSFSDGVWKRRTRPHLVPTIGRMYYVSPAAGERFYIRLQLSQRTGCSSVESLRTVNGVVHPTFKSACGALGLLQNDEEWILCLQEAAAWSSPANLRRLFCLILTQNSPSDPAAIWNHQNMKHYLSEDFKHQRINTLNLEPGSGFQEEDFTRALFDINKTIRVMTNDVCKLRDIVGMGAVFPENIVEPPPLVGGYAVAPTETPQQLLARATNNVLTINAEQRTAYDGITSVLLEAHHHPHSMFFLDAPGGTGKTYVLNTLSTRFRASDKVVVNVASSGIAAILLENGKTAHSRFGLSLDIHPQSVSSIRPLSDAGLFLASADIIIWDEVPMTHKDVIGCVDRLMRDLKQTPDVPFGGTSIIFAGDFRQILPVVKRGSKAQIREACINKLEWLNDVTKYQLKTNERVRRGTNNPQEGEAFCEFLLKVGDAHASLKVPQLPEDYIQLMPQYVFDCKALQDEDLHRFLKWCYPSIDQPTMNAEEIAKRAIVAPLNHDVNRLNDVALTMMITGNQITLRSADSIEESEGFFPLEYINSLDIPGMPPHELKLKKRLSCDTSAKLRSRKRFVQWYKVDRSRYYSSNSHCISKFRSK